MLKIRVLIADDHAMMRMGIRGLLSTHSSIEIVGEAADGEEVVAKTKELVPDIVIMDLSMPRINGFEATAQILRDMPLVKIIILSMYENKEYVSQFMKSGAAGYVLKNNSPGELLLAIQAVSNGGAYFSPSVSHTILNDVQSVSGKKSHELTEREQTALILLAQGFSSKEIAEKMLISFRTVAKYREEIMKKLDLHSVAELTQYAISNNLIKITNS